MKGPAAIPAFLAGLCVSPYNGDYCYNTDTGGVLSLPDLYLWGFITPAELDTMASELRYMNDAPGCDAPYDGPISTWSSADIIATNGPRVPDAAAAPKSFRTGVILVHKPGFPPQDATVHNLVQILNAFSDTFHESTLRRGRMDFSLDQDCDNNGVADCIEIEAATAEDCNANAIPDACELDCNENGTADECEIAMAVSLDLDGDGVIDSCERILYVNAAAAPAGNGQDWERAFTDLQAALDEAGRYRSLVKEIWVAAGTYKPSRANDIRDPRTATFQLLNDVTMYGGFGGFEAALDQRDLAANVTTLSGDIGVPGDVLDNAYHVLTGTGADASAVVDGFQVTLGNANATYPHDAGGGIRMSPGRPRIQNCRFVNNLAIWGGAMEINDASLPQIVDSTFENNYAQRVGGVVNNRAGGPSFLRCVFKGNSAGTTGGAVYVWDGSTAEFVDSWFEANRASYGGAVKADNSNPIFRRCTFVGNQAISSNGGAMDNYRSSPVIMDSRFFANTAANAGGAITNYENAHPRCINCLFSGNVASRGAAIWNLFGSHPTLINCTLSENAAFNLGGGMFNEQDCRPTISNTILWHNRDSSGTGQAAQIRLQSSASPFIRFSCLQGWSGSFGGPGNSGLDPMTVDPDGPDNVIGSVDDDLRLSPDSPILNSGDSNVPELPTTDLDGHARELCGPVDIGAYEFGIGNYDCDHLVDLSDFLAWQKCRTAPIPPQFPGLSISCRSFDFDGQGTVDLRDFAAFSRTFFVP